MSFSSYLVNAPSIARLYYILYPIYSGNTIRTEQLTQCHGRLQFLDTSIEKLASGEWKTNTVVYVTMFFLRYYLARTAMRGAKLSLLQAPALIMDKNRNKLSKFGNFQGNNSTSSILGLITMVQRGCLLLCFSSQRHHFGHCFELLAVLSIKKYCSWFDKGIFVLYLFVLEKWNCEKQQWRKNGT